MRTLKKLFKLLTFAGLLLGLSLSGCVQIAPIPSVARSGDTIVLGLGGINRNWQGAKPKNLHIVLTDAGGHTYTLIATVVFQAYPDYRASTTVMALDGSDGVKLQPYDGGWFVSVGLTDSAGQPLNLAVGRAVLNITADNLTTVVDDQNHIYEQEGDLTQLPLDIIAGTATNTNSTMQFGAYDNRGTHFLVRPASTSATLIGGAYYVINYQSDSSFGSIKPMVFPVSHNPFIKMDYKILQNGNGSGSYAVYIYNPSGFIAASPRQPKQGSLQDLGVHLEYFDSGADASVKTNFSIDQANSYYIDINGNKLTDLHPEMIHASDL